MIYVISEDRGLDHFADAKDLREAWVLANFCTSFFEGKLARVALVSEDKQFPDGQVLLDRENTAEDYEIIDAFEGGTGHPNKESRIFGRVVDGKIKGKGWNTENLIEGIAEALKKAIEKKIAKNYSIKPNLLIYLRDIVTFEEWRELSQLQKYFGDGVLSNFKSVNVLSSSGKETTQLYPDFIINSDAKKRLYG